MQVGSAMRSSSTRFIAGFTLIELLVVLAILTALLGITAPMYLNRVEAAREVTLRHNLAGLRSAIDQFLRDRQRYPAKLAELVEARYLRALYADPLTGDAWLPIRGEGGSIEGVRSAAALHVNATVLERDFVFRPDADVDAKVKPRVGP